MIVWGERKMYSLLTNIARESRGSKLLREVEKALGLLLYYSESDARDFIEAYVLSLKNVQDLHGNPSDISAALRIKVAHGLAMSALACVQRSKASANGIAMAAAKLEVMSLACEDALMALGYLLTLEETMADYADD
jgi:hypothetical protein